MTNRRRLGRKWGDFGIVSWRIVLGGTRFHGKILTHEQKDYEVRENRRPFARPYQGERPKSLSPCSRPLYLRCIYIHRKRRPVPESPERVLYFVSDPSCRFSTREPRLFLSAGTREFDL